MDPLLDFEDKNMEHEKRLRREIANSNERRRMQSINAGFAGLRNLLPNHDGEKLSKAAILQQTSDYIYQLLQDKNKLLGYNSQLKRMVAQNGGADSAAGSGNCSSPQSPAASNDAAPSVTKRRKTVDGALESADEGIGSMSPEHSVTSDEAKMEIIDLRRETMELRLALERERRHRIGLEEHIAILQQQQTMFPRKIDVDRMPSEDVDGFQTGSGSIIAQDLPRCYTVRNNLETIVEAIRHLEGDHLFSDDRNHSTPTSSPPSGSPRAIEIVSTTSLADVSERFQTPEMAPSIESATVEVPLALTATLSSASCQALPIATTYIVATSPNSATSQVSAGALKKHVFTPVTSKVEVEDQPINLEFRPGLSRSPSPFNNQPSPSSCQQQQIRPGVIVVKHS